MPLRVPPFRSADDSDAVTIFVSCYTFELEIITRSRYKRAALFTNGIISFTSVLLFKTVTMVHTSKVYKYASYEESTGITECFLLKQTVCSSSTT